MLPGGVGGGRMKVWFSACAGVKSPLFVSSIISDSKVSMLPATASPCCQFRWKKPQIPKTLVFWSSIVYS
jgi:hypothetical protein